MGNIYWENTESIKLNEGIMKKIKLLLNELIVKYEKHITVINFLLLYRYISLGVTLIFYFFTAPHKNPSQKMMIMVCLLLAYTTMTLLNFFNQKKPKLILALGIIETIENSVFIIISGGFSSPFIWYFVSSIFISAANISQVIAILFAVIYFVSASITTIYTMMPSQSYDVTQLYLNTAFSYILVVIGLLQVIRYAVKVEENASSLSRINRELEDAKSKVEKMLRYTLELYETVNLFHLDRKEDILQELNNHMKYLLNVDQSIFVQLSPANKRGNYVSSGVNEEDANHIVDYVLELYNQEINYSSGYYHFKEKELLLHFVMYDKSPCGVFIAIPKEKVMKLQSDFFQSYEEAIETKSLLPIFIKIAGVMLKKMEFEEIEEQLLIGEEQNRIANEIHDIVLQKLFSISCKLYLLSADSKNLAEEELRAELYGIKQSIDVTMKELREAIYGFSWDKKGEDTFKTRLLMYTEEIRSLQGVEAITVIEGDTQKVRVNQKQGLYRIICEAMNNAIRHGKAKHINVKITIDQAIIAVHIKDDGKGFDLNKYTEKDEKGLGINNMYRTIELLSGTLEINSNKLNGTEIYITIPCRPAA